MPRKTPTTMRETPAKRKAPAKKTVATKKPAAAKPKRPASTKVTKHLEKARPVTIHLDVQHSINGRNYGPGDVRVPTKIANVLLEQERRSKESEDRLWEARSHIVVASQSGPNRKYSVANDSFDQLLAKPPAGLMLKL